MSNGSTVQVDRLGAFDVKTGQPRELFDTRLNLPYKSKQRPLKNGASRSDPEPWLLSAVDGKYSCRGVGQDLLFTENGKTTGFRAPGDVRSIASTGEAWVVLTNNQLLTIDKSTRAARATVSFQGDARMHGLGIANSRVFITTEDGRLLCFAGSSPDVKSDSEKN